MSPVFSQGFYISVDMVLLLGATPFFDLFLFVLFYEYKSWSSGIRIYRITEYSVFSLSSKYIYKESHN